MCGSGTPLHAAGLMCHPYMICAIHGCGGGRDNALKKTWEPVFFFGLGPGRKGFESYTYRTVPPPPVSAPGRRPAKKNWPSIFTPRLAHRWSASQRVLAPLAAPISSLERARPSFKTAFPLDVMKIIPLPVHSTAMRARARVRLRARGDRPPRARRGLPCLARRDERAQMGAKMKPIVHKNVLGSSRRVHGPR